MTINNLGFGGVSGSGYQALSTLVREFSTDRFQSTINNESPLIGSKVLEQIDAKGSEITPYITAGGMHSTAWVRDYDLLPQGGSYTPTKARVVPSNLITVMKMGRAAHLATLGDEGLSELFDANLTLATEDNARHLGRGLYGGTVSPVATAAWSNNTAAGTATVSLNFADASMFKPGAAYDYVDLNTAISYVVRCLTVTPAGPFGGNSDNVAATVTFINDVPSPATNLPIAINDAGAVTVALGDTFALRGTSPGFGGSSTAVVGNALTSFADIASSTGDLHGVSTTAVPGWFGHTKALSGSPAYSQELITAFAMRIRQYSGKYFTHAIYSPQLAAAHAASAGIHGAAFGVGSLTVTASHPQATDKTADKYSNLGEWDSGLRVGGRPILVDPNCPATQIVLHNREKTKLAVWKKMGPDEEAGDPVFVDRDRFTVSCQYSGMYQLFTTQRQVNGIITGFGSL